MTLLTSHSHLWVLSPADGKLRCVVCKEETDVPKEEARKILEFERLLKSGQKGGLKVTEATPTATTQEAPAAKPPKVERVLPEGAIELKDAATQLGTDPKSLRRRLRAKGWQKPGSRWYLMPDQLQQLATEDKEPKPEKKVGRPKGSGKATTGNGEDDPEGQGDEAE